MSVYIENIFDATFFISSTTANLSLSLQTKVSLIVSNPILWLPQVVVVSVVTAECCECMAEGGRVLGNVDPAWLETVIPKQSPMVVMVVKGPYNGQVCTEVLVSPPVSLISCPTYFLFFLLPHA